MRKIGKFPGKVFCSNRNRIRIIIIPQQYWILLLLLKQTYQLE